MVQSDSVTTSTSTVMNVTSTITSHSPTMMLTVTAPVYLKLPLSGHVSSSSCDPFMRYRNTDRLVVLTSPMLAASIVDASCIPSLL